MNHLPSSTKFYLTVPEKYVPEFYDKVGSKLSVWKKPAPQIKSDRASASDVTTDAISEESDTFEA